MNTWAEIEAKFEIYCPHCNAYTRRVPQEPIHARLMQAIRDGKLEDCEVTGKCTHCGQEYLVSKIKL